MATDNVVPFPLREARRDVRVRSLRRSRRYGKLLAAVITLTAVAGAFAWCLTVPGQAQLVISPYIGTAALLFGAGIAGLILTTNASNFLERTYCGFSRPASTRRRAEALQTLLLLLFLASLLLCVAGLGLSLAVRVTTLAPASY